MVRTFPEAGFIVNSINSSIGFQAPEPFTIFTVDKMLLYKIPALQSLFKSVFIVANFAGIDSLSFDVLALRRGEALQRWKEISLNVPQKYPVNALIN